MRLNDTQVDQLGSQGYQEGDNVPGRGILTPLGTFRNTPTPEPTIGQSLGMSDQLNSIKTEALRIQEILNGRQAAEAATPRFAAPEADVYGDSSIESLLRSSALGGVDEEAIRRNQMKLFQKEIDAVNDVYDGYVRDARFEGEGRLGSQRAIGARGGLLGSDFAGAQKDKVQGYNADIISGIQNERTAKVQGILGFARQAAADEIAAKTKAQQEGADSYLAYLGNAQANKANNIQKVASALITQGIDPTQITDELTEVASGLGTTVDEIISQYGILSSGGDAGEQFTLSEGQQRFDAAGNLIAAGADKSSDDTIYSTSKGLVRIGSNGQPELIFSTGGGGGAASTAKPDFTSGSLEVSKETASEMSKYLETSRGDDGFANTEAYVDIVQQMIDQGGKLDDILDQFDPKDYVNPSDSSVPGYIKRRLPNATGTGSSGLPSWDAT